jgi:hypothetical protein
MDDSEERSNKQNNFFLKKKEGESHLKFVLESLILIYGKKKVLKIINSIKVKKI